MHSNQDFASVIKNFDYRGSRTYKVEVSSLGMDQVKYADNSHELKRITNVQIDKECALITELYDMNKRNYMYVMMNIIDSQERGSTGYQTMTVTFDDRYTHVLMFKNAINEPIIVELDKNNQLVVEQHAVEAVYVIPY